MHSPGLFGHWIRQHNVIKKSMNEERVFQVSQVPITDPTRRPEVVALTSKSSAAKLIAALSERTDTGYRYAVTAVFLQANLPGLERPQVPAWYPARIAERQREMER
jgi:hypothetical protein